MNDGPALYESLTKTLEAEGEEEEVELSNAQVLRQTIAWEPLQGAKIITEEELTYIKNFDKKPSEEREALLDEVSPAFNLNLLNTNLAPDGSYLC